LPKRIVFAVIALLFSLAIVAAQTPTVSQAEITQVGIYEAKVTGKTAAPGAASGYVDEVNYHFVSNATTVPARKGIRFGFEYRLVGLPKGAKFAIRK
jgi:hypothetical protein